VNTAQTTGEVYLHGAHVTAWQPSGAAPVLWVSRDSLFEAAKPIRGGVPICFPWFAAHATDTTAPMHGFARLAEWHLADATSAGGAVHLSFELTDDEASRKSAWPHRFRAEFRVSLGERLGLALDVSNPGEAPLAYEAALHSYFAVGDIRQVTVTGLGGTDYLDKVEGFSRKRQDETPIGFVGETDRIYLDTEATTAISPSRDRFQPSSGIPGSIAHGHFRTSVTTSGPGWCASRPPTFENVRSRSNPAPIM
jgi:D-hexose-6-phosphate mutarotase